MAKKAAKMAVQMFSFRDFCGTPKDSIKTLTRLKKIGYKNIQMSGPIGGHDAFEMKKAVDKLGMKIIGAHIGVDQMRNDFAAVVDRLHAWDCDYVAIPALGGDERKTAAAWKKRAKEFSKLGKQFAEEGIVLQYHNHAFEFEKFGGKAGLEILYAESDPKFLQAEIDTHWVTRGGGEPSDWCLRMKGRMDQVHLKDLIVVNNEPVFAAIGEGNLNWPAILTACKKIGVKDYIIEQDTCPTTNDPFKSFKMSHAFLKKMGIGV